MLITAHDAGGGVVQQLYKTYKKEFEDKVCGIALTASVWLPVGGGDPYIERVSVPLY